MEPWTIVITAVITSLLSPLFLKLAEFVLNKSTQKERAAAQLNKERDDKIAALGKRVDELRDANTKLMVKTEIQERTINEQAQQITQLKSEVGKRDDRIKELETQVDILQHRRKQ